MGFLKYLGGVACEILGGIGMAYAIIGFALNKIIGSSTPDWIYIAIGIACFVLFLFGRYILRPKK
jgi:hypothetical protein